MLILGLLGMYFDAVVVIVTSQTLLFRLALAILCFALLTLRKTKVLKAGVSGEILKCHSHSLSLSAEL